MIIFVLISSYKHMTSYSTTFHDESATVVVLIHGQRSVKLKGFADQHLQPEHWTGPTLAHVPVRSSTSDIANAVARKTTQARLAWVTAWLLSLFGVGGISFALASRF